MSFSKDHIKKKTLALKKNKQLLDSILISTETYFSEEIECRYGIVSAQSFYGIDSLKSIVTSLKNAIGGRLGSLEKALEKATKQVTDDLKFKAYLYDANAVISVRIEHTYNDSILSVYATGTVVKFTTEEEKQ